MELPLPPVPPASRPARLEASPPPVRVREPERRQATMRFELPEDALPPSHPARLLWSVLGTLDLTPFLASAKSVEGIAGRSVLSPRVLLSLWLFGLLSGISSAREIARRILSDDAFRWIAGDLRVSHDKLSDFLVGHRAALESLFTDVVGVLLHKGLITLDVAAQDGMRVRASASAPSFRTLGSLLECREQAELHLKAVLAEANDPEPTSAEHAAREAAARDYQRRVEEAIVEVKDMQATRKAKDAPPRASTTDRDFGPPRKRGEVTTSMVSMSQKG